MSFSKLAPDRLVSAQRKAEAVKLRLRGLSFKTIGARLGVSKQRAHQLVAAALRDALRESQLAAAELLDVELRRTDALWEVMFARVGSRASAAAADVCLRVLAQRARLLGIESHPADDEDRLHELLDRQPRWLDPDPPLGDDAPAADAGAPTPIPSPAGDHDQHPTPAEVVALLGRFGGPATDGPDDEPPAPPA
jgi:hypothetical protein